MDRAAEMRECLRTLNEAMDADRAKDVESAFDKYQLGIEGLLNMYKTEADAEQKRWLLENVRRRCSSGGGGGTFLFVACPCLRCCGLNFVLSVIFFTLDDGAHEMCAQIRKHMARAETLKPLVAEVRAAREHSPLQRDALAAFHNAEAVFGRADYAQAIGLYAIAKARIQAAMQHSGGSAHGAALVSDAAVQVAVQSERLAQWRANGEHFTGFIPLAGE